MKKEQLLFKGYHYPMESYWDNHHNRGFTQLSLDLSSNCNYHCDWCFNKELLNKDNSDLLNLTRKKLLLEESIELGAKTLVIPGTGEPTLDPDFYPLIEHAYGLDMISVVYSNLTGNLDKDRISQLHEQNVSIGIKLDSLKPEYFARRYHVTEKLFDRYMNNLNSIVSAYKDSKEHTSQGTVYQAIANMVLTHENKEELPEISGFCKKKDLPLFVRPVKPVTWAKNNPATWREIGNKTGEYTPDKELVKLAHEYNTLFSPSSTLENHCAIYSFGLTVKNNGDIQICPDHHDSRGEFGNIADVDMQEVMKQLNSSRIIKPGFCIMLPDIEHKF